VIEAFPLFFPPVFIFCFSEKGGENRVVRVKEGGKEKKLG
jgi:hypothetical protein